MQTNLCYVLQDHVRCCFVSRHNFLAHGSDGGGDDCGCGDRKLPLEMRAAAAAAAAAARERKTPPARRELSREVKRCHGYQIQYF